MQAKVSEPQPESHELLETVASVYKTRTILTCLYFTFQTLKKKQKKKPTTKHHLKKITFVAVMLLRVHNQLFNCLSNY